MCIHFSSRAAQLHGAMQVGAERADRQRGGATPQQQDVHRGGARSAGRRAGLSERRGDLEDATEWGEGEGAVMLF